MYYFNPLSTAPRATLKSKRWNNNDFAAFFATPKNSTLDAPAWHPCNTSDWPPRGQLLLLRTRRGLYYVGEIKGLQVRLHRGIRGYCETDDALDNQFRPFLTFDRWTPLPPLD